MRWNPASVALCSVAAAFLTACGGAGAGDGAGGEATEETCAALTEMHSRARAIEQANLAHPSAFAEELDRAVREYRAELDALREVAPDRLHDAIDRLGRAVSKHDFEAGFQARQTLDEFHAAECLPATAPTTPPATTD